jgi:hypothetical protein
MNALEAFAKRERLRIRRDECGDPIIAGRYGQFDDNQDRRIGVCLVIRPTDSLYRAKLWKQRLLKLCHEDGPECLVEGDYEAVFACRLDAREFLKLSIRALGVVNYQVNSPTLFSPEMDHSG